MVKQRRVLHGFAVSIAITLLSAGSFIPAAQAAMIPEALAIRAIIGEASGEGYPGMLAVACAIRNRGSLRGVYGVNARHVDREPSRVWDLARKAWKESLSRDVVNGADHWESVSFKVPDWAKNMVVAARIGKHVFYKERR